MSEAILRKKCISCHQKGKKTSKGWSGAYKLDGVIGGHNKYKCINCGSGFVPMFHNSGRG